MFCCLQTDKIVKLCFLLDLCGLGVLSRELVIGSVMTLTSALSVTLQFPSNGSNQIHIPALSVDGLSTPVVLSPGPQKP